MAGQARPSRKTPARYNSNPNVGVFFGLLIVGGVIGGSIMTSKSPPRFLRDGLRGDFSSAEAGAGAAVEYVSGGAAAAADAPAEIKGELLVLDDLTAAQPVLRDAVFARLTANASRLGYRLLKRDDGPEIEALEIESRATFGTPPADAADPAFRARVHEWVKSKNDLMHGVIRLSWEGSAEGQRPKAELFAPNLDRTWLLHQLQRD